MPELRWDDLERKIALLEARLAESERERDELRAQVEELRPILKEMPGLGYSLSPALADWRSAHLQP